MSARKGRGKAVSFVSRARTRRFLREDCKWRQPVPKRFWAMLEDYVKECAATFAKRERNPQEELPL